MTNSDFGNIQIESSYLNSKNISQYTAFAVFWIKKCRLGEQERIL